MKKQRVYRFDGRICPEELVLEIILWLPVKSLLRFKSVCKDWKSLISSHSFRNIHRERHISSPPLFLTLHSKRKSAWPGDFYLTTLDLHGKIVQEWTLPITWGSYFMINSPSKSKLLCFFEIYIMQHILAYNPSTRQLFRLPDPPCCSLPLEDYRISCNTYGYIPSKDEYMFAHMVEKRTHKNDEYMFVLMVLTVTISNDNFQLHYNEWRSIKAPTNVHSFCSSLGVYVCGAFYWQAGDLNDNNFILSFDVRTEVFSTFGLPQGIPFIQLLELRDELYLMDEREQSLTLKLWKLSTDVNNNKSWALHWNLNLHSLGFTKYPDHYEFDWKILIYRLEYLYSYNEPFNVEMGKLMLEEDVYLGHGTLIHSNLFTL